MEIKEGNNQLYVGDASQPDAFISFKEAGENTLEVDETLVSESMRGSGVGGQLVEAVADYARDHNKKLVASCPYAAKKLSSDGQYDDVYQGEA